MNMKKIISILIIYLLFSSVVAAQLQKNNLKELNLKGKVRRLGEFAYEAVEKDGVVQKVGRRDAFVIDFNESGNMTRKRYFESTEVIYQRDTCLYDGEGRMIEKNVYDRWGKLDPKYTYKYDGNQKMVEKNTYNADGSFDGRAVYKYNKYGPNLNVIDEFFYDEKGGRTGGNVFRYDSLWNLIGDKMYTYKYDSSGNLVEKINGSPIYADMKYTYQYEYDKNLNWIKSVEFVNGKPYNIKERIIAYY